MVHSERAGGGMSGDWTRGSIGGFSLEGCDVIVGSVVEVGVLGGRERRKGHATSTTFHSIRTISNSNSNSDSILTNEHLFLNVSSS